MRRSYLAVTLAAILSTVGLGGCSGTAGLSELPQQESSKLQPVPNTQFLATKIKPSISKPPVDSGRSAALCPADHLYSFYDAQITMPITICSLNKLPTLELANPVPSEKKKFKFSIADRFYTCSVQNGPWTAQITSERMCIGTCSPLNTLIVIGVPNLVQFSWYGSVFDDHPAAFEYVAPPVLTETTSLGPCNSFAAHPGKRYRKK